MFVAASTVEGGSPIGVALPAGVRFGPYRILSSLGVGGMGEVYRALDTRLQRDVAVKVLLPAVANDPDRLARFAREARVLASLNHPNIAQVYGLEESNDVPALVMELVEGSTLADRITQGAIPVEEALQIGKQIAEALEAAHEHGIIHRDLKPANVKVRRDGQVKVLDFGLAKALGQGMDGDEQISATTVAGVSMPGLIVGTAAYMAPEQAKGRPVDRRADLWAFGCVLFEMLAGRRAFDGDSLPTVLLKVVEQEPDWNTLPAKTPASIRTLLRRCLEKEPKRRLDSAAAARIEIDETLKRPSSDLGHDPTRTSQDRDPGKVPSKPPPSQARNRSIRMALAMLAATIIVVTATTWLLTSREESSVPAVPRLKNAVQVTSALDVESYPTWSPDGVRLAYQASEEGWYYVGNHDIWVAQLGSGEPVNLTKGNLANDRMPSWSPDGREIAFFSDRDGVWGVYTVAAIGGTARNVLSLPGIAGNNWSSPQWSSDGTKLLVSVQQANENVVIILSLQSLETTRVALPRHEGNFCHDLSVSPDGRRFAYVEGGGGATEVTRLWTIPATGGEAVPFTDGRTNVWSPTWSKDGRKVFYVSNRGGSMDLWQQALVQDGTPVGDPLAVTQGLGIRSAAFSPDGARLAYTRGGRVSNVWRVPLISDRPATWADAAQLTSERAFIEFVDVSPDSKLLAVSSDRRGNQDLWLLPAAGGEMTPLTTDPAPDWNPRWSPDGNEIAFYAYRSGNRDIWVMPSRGGPARQLTSDSGQDRYPSWSPDGREIAFLSVGKAATLIVGAKGGEPRFVTTGGTAADWSPDGHWLVVERQRRLYRIAKEGGEPSPFPPHRYGGVFTSLLA
jgi:eukaryotic-like serine/threonine-protein kinase